MCRTGLGGSLLFSVEDNEVSLYVIQTLLQLTILEERQTQNNISSSIKATTKSGVIIIQYFFPAAESESLHLSINLVIKCTKIALVQWGRDTSYRFGVSGTYNVKNCSTHTRLLYSYRFILL